MRARAGIVFGDEVDGLNLSAGGLGSAAGAGAAGAEAETAAGCGAEQAQACRLAAGATLGPRPAKKRSTTWVAASRAVGLFAMMFAAGFAGAATPVLRAK
ncbi:MAG: hypothetical protein R2724_15965 [Bryobacterales bacterium]